MNLFDEIEAIASNGAKFGNRITSLGSRLYGHVPHIAPEAWFHVIHRDLHEREINDLQKSLGDIIIPDNFRKFLSYANGVSLFSGEISIYGLRWSYDRAGDAAWQPFSILIPNIEERPKARPSNYFVVGRYYEDGSRIVIDNTTGKVIRLPSRKDIPALSEWPDFSTMLTQEIKRISCLFDSTGHLLHEGDLLFLDRFDGNQVSGRRSKR